MEKDIQIRGLLIYFYQLQIFIDYNNKGVVRLM